MTQQQPNRPRRTSQLPRRRRLAVALAAVGLVALAACGGDDSDDEGGLSANETSATTEASGGARTVEVEMVDNEFSPSEVEVAAGETVRFVFSNTGQVTHDAVIGDEATQMEHEEEMRAAESTGMDDGMGHGEAESEGALTVEPGSTGELMHTFSAGDEVLIGCHQPGHYDAGMRMSIKVTDA